MECTECLEKTCFWPLFLFWAVSVVVSWVVSGLIALKGPK